MRIFWKRLLPLLVFLVFYALGLPAEEEDGRLEERHRLKNSLRVQKLSQGRFFTAEGAEGLGKFGLLGLNLPNFTKAQSYLNWLKPNPKTFYPKARRITRASVRYLKRNLRRNDVYGIAAPSRKDFAGRTLVLVKLPNHKKLNLEMIRQGFAYPRWTEMDQKQKKEFRAALSFAIQKKRGLWQLWQALQKKEKDLSQRKLHYKKQKKVTLMTYNLENLFDTEDSPDTRDYAYLPAALKKSKKHKKLCASLSRHRKKECLRLDWSSERLKTKMERLAQVILSVNEGKGADVLFLQEVENYAILKHFRDTYLSSAQYTITHFESRDSRGIDVAILSRLDTAALPEYHEIDFGRFARTRGILHVPLVLPDSKVLHTLVFHLPSQGAPQIMRKQALRFLALLKKSLGKNALVVAAGDCNVTTKEEKALYPRYASPFWSISHYAGCKECSGTSYYPPKKSWSFFDVFYFSKVLNNKQGKWHIPPESIRVFTPMAFQKKKDNTPNPYRLGSFSGVSDHWPMLLDIQHIE